MKDEPGLIWTFAEEQYQKKLPVKINRSKSVYIVDYL